MQIQRFGIALPVLLSVSAAWSLEVTQGPILTMDPNGVTPLAGVVTLTTDEATQAALNVSGNGDSWRVEFPGQNTNHSLLLLGLKPNGSYTISVELISPDGFRVDPPLSAATGPLPADYPQIRVDVSIPSQMQPGYTLVDRIIRNRTEDPNLGLYTTILNSVGEVVWYSTEGASNTRLLPNGNLFYRVGPFAREQDLLGNIVSELQWQNPGLEMHHDLFPTDNGPNGSHLSLTREIVTVDNFPTSDTDPNAPTVTQDVMDEPAVEFDAVDGSVMTYCRMVDMIDPTRIGYNSLTEMRDFPGVVDWVHNNAITEDGDDLIVSVRHQDAVIKFTRNCELIWILGNHNGWGPAFQQYLLAPVGSPFEWQYHEHAPMVTDDGTLVLFDNGNERATPFDGTAPIPDAANYSRAVEYRIDEVNMTVEQVWEYGSPATGMPRLFSRFISDADRLPNGNTLIDYGGNTFTDGASNESLGLGDNVVRIIETDHGTPAQKVLDLTMFNPTAGARIAAYRAERVPSLYASNVTILGEPGNGNLAARVDNGGIGALLFAGLGGLLWYRRRRARLS